MVGMPYLVLGGFGLLIYRSILAAHKARKAGEATSPPTLPNE